MSRTKIKLNEQGIRELLKSQELGAVVIDEAQKILNRAGDGYEMESRTQYPERSGAVVRTATPEAMRDNSTNNTLRKALGK